MNEETKQPAAIIKRQRVVLEGLEPQSLVRSNNGAQACGKKSARLVEHEGRARAIEFSCSCGEATLVELVFEEQPQAGKVGVQS
jgi:hypothetical protein